MRSVDPDFDSAEVAAVFAAYPPDIRAALLRLRRLILETAEATEGVGAVQETLKWGQPSYLTPQSGSGTPIRIDRVRSAPGRYALYVHCQTDLIASLRARYPDGLTYEGDRAIVFDRDDDIPEDILRHAIALALTYHRRKSRTRREAT